MSDIDIVLNDFTDSCANGARAAAARAELAALRDNDVVLHNLLAVIHRDGGHRVSDVGTLHASKEAEDIVIKLRGVVDEQVRQLKEARQLLTDLDWNDWDERVDEWLAANAPAQPAPQVAWDYEAEPHAVGYIAIPGDGDKQMWDE